MFDKTVSGKSYRFTAAVFMGGMLWLAACSPAATTQTSKPEVQATAVATTAAETTTTAATTETTTTVEAGSADTETAAATIVKLNLNTATSEEFLTIPDVGDRMVREFEEYRPYISIQQFRQEIGKYVDEAQVAAYEEYVYVPVVPNNADAETLQQLPGVTPEVAEALIAGRPYDSNVAFLDALGEHVTPEELAIGESYLESE
jgi:DNA uptake protein ComE-like DNA-binding protein